jgi:hypothetical protein
MLPQNYFATSGDIFFLDMYFPQREKSHIELDVFKPERCILAPC